MTDYESLHLHRDAKLIVNTTPVGMYPRNGESPLQLSGFPECEAVLDIIYNPARTRLLLDAEKAGLRAANGLYMLVAQAKRSSERFTGTMIPDEKTDEIEKILSLQMKNLVLIGMPGCGKTTIASRLAKRTGRKVIDLDVLFEEENKISPARCIEECGEPEFRKMETEVIRKAGAFSGNILSTGGGCVTVPDNYDLLHQNGILFWIRRDISKLAVAGRPLSGKGSLPAMYEKRRPLYEAFADYTVDNDKSPEKTVDRILDIIADM